MGLLNFLKKLGKEKRIEETVLEKLTFSEIENWIERKKEENELKEKEILALVKDKIIDFNAGLRVKIITLKEFDVESKKAEDKLKEIVKDSRAKYIETVETLMTNLENIKETRFFDFTKKIDKMFFDFKKSSFKNYERATFLIGKEMADIKESLNVLSKDLLEIFNSGKEITELFSKVEIIKSKLKLLQSIENKKVEINDAVKSFNEKISQKEKENQRLSAEIEKIKQSQNHKEMLERKQKIALLDEELKNEISELKQLIDFKSLTNFFHINEEQMNLVKSYKENFNINFEKDHGKKIVELLDESKLNTDIILEKMSLIQSKMGELTKYKREIKKDEVQELSNKIEEIVIEVNILKMEKIKEEKRDEKLVTNKEELISLLKQELGKMNVELI